jgi:hypothetical protein
MTYTAAQLDQIVKLVVERLRHMPIVGLPRQEEKQRELAIFHDVQAGEVDTSTLALAEKVITTASLENRLEGISRVLVATGSVVTPSARDLLGDRKIPLQRGGKPVRSAGCTLVIGSDQASIDPTTVAGSLTANFLPHDSCWKNQLGSVTSQISGSRKLGVLITGKAAAAACLANRNHQLRAMTATTADQVHSDKHQLGANLLVIDPSGRGVHGVRQLIDAFARDGYLDSPRSLEL